MTPKGFEVIVALLSSAWPSAPFGWEPQEVYRAGLSEFDDEVVLDAVNALVRSQTFLPALAVVRRAILERSGGMVTVGEAWEEVRRNRQSRAGGRAQWSSPLVRRAAEAVDWSSSEWQSAQLPMIAERFERTYKGLCAKALGDPAMLHDPLPRQVAGARSSPRLMRDIIESVPSLPKPTGEAIESTSNQPPDNRDARGQHD